MSICVPVGTTPIYVPVGFTLFGRIQTGPNLGVLGRAALALLLVAPSTGPRASSLTVLRTATFSCRILGHVLMPHPRPRSHATTANARASRVQVTVWVSSLIEP